MQGKNVNLKFKVKYMHLNMYTFIYVIILCTLQIYSRYLLYLYFSSLKNINIEQINYDYLKLNMC